MADNLKYKKWITDIGRVRGGVDTRFDKVRLDKNERLAHFGDDFWNKMLLKIKQEHILAYPEVETLYLKLAGFLGMTPGNLLITAGSDFAIKVAFELFVSPGDEVVFLHPTFAMVEVYCELYNGRMKKIGYDSNLEPDIDGLMASINEKTSLIIIANPNSPTGTYIGNDVIKEILEKSRGLSIPVLIDEAYYGFCPHTAVDLINTYDNLVVTRTFSKTAGLAGLRIGYAVAAPALAGLLYKFRPLYEVNSVAVLFVSELLDNWRIVEEYIDAVDEGKRYFISELEGLSFRTINTRANFIHADFGQHREIIIKGFDRDGILMRGSLNVKGFESYSRISVGTVGEMEKAVASIKSSLSK